MSERIKLSDSDVANHQERWFPDEVHRWTVIQRESVGTFMEDRWLAVHLEESE